MSPPVRSHDTPVRINRPGSPLNTMMTPHAQTVDYESLFASFDTAIIIFNVNDPDFTIIEENKAHATLAMTNRDDVIGKRVLDVFPDTSVEYIEKGNSQLLESFRRVIKTGRSDAMPQLDYPIKNESGELVHRTWRVVHWPLKNSEGRVTAVYQATVDITDESMTKHQLSKTQHELAESNQKLEQRVVQRTRKLQDDNSNLEAEVARRIALEEELHEKSANLERSNQELQDFAYVASHDLQEPLRKIQAFGDLLESEYGAQLDDGLQYLERMRNAASRMSTLIEDLLSFSRITTKVRPVTSVDLNDVASGVISDLESRIERTGGDVLVESLPKVMADPLHMRQLFQNLIGNALKFHQPDIAPKVRVYVLPDESSNGYNVICFEDNGIGFDEKYLDRIFSVFQRLHGKEAYEGTGIGLAVCRKIAERYGGTITATSKKDHGSTFIVTIPRTEERLAS